MEQIISFVVRHIQCSCRYVLPFFQHIAVLIGISFTTGLIIRLYGNTCGIDLFNPISWPFSLITVVSPWCSRLATLSLWMITAIENLWIILCTLMMMSVVSSIPSDVIRKAFPKSIPFQKLRM